MNGNYVPLLRRRREGVTDYRSRKRAIASDSPLLVVRITNKNVSCQFVKPTVKGDVVVSAAHSKELSKLGWQGSLKSTPACYLLGLLAGRKAVKEGVKEAVVYMGVAPFINGSRTAAFLKGVVDAGVDVPVGEEVFPSEERISGKSIAEYAERLSKDDEDAYKARFSAMLKSGFKPEEYPSHFDKTKAAVMEAKV